MRFTFALRLNTKTNVLAKLRSVFDIDDANAEKIRIMLHRGWTVVAQDITGFELEPPEESHEDHRHAYH